MALMLVSMTTFAGGRTTKSATTSGFDWNPVMDAIILVESEGNPKAALHDGRPLQCREIEGDVPVNPKVL